MDDRGIVELYWQRSERAIAETSEKYGAYLHSIAYQILHDREDAQECVNDTYLDAWNGMPPHRPSILATFLGKLTRRISIDRFRHQSAKKRGGGEMLLILDELSECVAGGEGVEEEYEKKRLRNMINDFVSGLPDMERQVFLCRYWYMEPVGAIGERFGFSESKVKSMLHRTRGKLGKLLEKEGFA